MDRDNPVAAHYDRTSLAEALVARLRDNIK